MSRSRTAASATGALAAIAVGALIGLTVLLPATGAVAQAPAAVGITLNEPVIDGSVASISGAAEMAGLLDWVTGVTVTASHPGTGDGCRGCGADVDTNQRAVEFSFTSRSLGYNGPYDVTVEVTGRRLVDSFNTAEVSGQRTTAFRVEVRPAPPANVQAVPNPDGTVNLSWTRNGEADLAGYQVLRRDPSSEFRPAGPPVPQPKDGVTVHWTDTSAAGGGRFEYQVVAIRPDGDGVVSDRATAASNTVGASVPVPAGARPGAAGVGASSTPGAARAPGGSPNRSSLLASGARPTPDLGPSFVEPDGEFSPTLPYGPGSRSERGGLSAAPADDAVVVLGQTTNQRAVLLSLAAGLLLCLAAFHLRLFNRRVLGPHPRSLNADSGSGAGPVPH